MEDATPSAIIPGKARFPKAKTSKNKANILVCPAAIKFVAAYGENSEVVLPGWNEKNTGVITPMAEIRYRIRYLVL